MQIIEWFMAARATGPKYWETRAQSSQSPVILILSILTGRNCLFVPTWWFGLYWARLH